MGYRQFQKNQRETVHEEYFSAMPKKEFMPFFDAQTAGRRFVAQHNADIESGFAETVYCGKADPGVAPIKLGSAFWWKMMEDDTNGKYKYKGGMPTVSHRGPANV